MTNNPIPLIVIFLLLRQQTSSHITSFNALNSLQLESLLDNIHTMIHAIEKLNSFSQAELASSLPDMKKMLEVVEKLPL